MQSLTLAKTADEQVIVGLRLLSQAELTLVSGGAREPGHEKNSLFANPLYVGASNPLYRGSGHEGDNPLFQAG